MWYHSWLEWTWNHWQWLGSPPHSPKPPHQIQFSIISRTLVVGSLTILQPKPTVYFYLTHRYTLSGSSTLGQRGTGSDDNKEVPRITQISSITWTSPLGSLGTYLSWEPYPSHHNGFFSLLLELRDLAAEADQYRYYPNCTRLLTFSA